MALDAGYTNNMPTSATSYDGVKRDISRFYEDKQTNFSIDGALILNTNTRIHLGYDNGYKTIKYQQSPTYRLGVDQWIGDNILISGWRQMRGSVSHNPCTDSYNRQYFCGDLTAWSDFRGTNNEDDYKTSITYIYRFGS